MKGRRIASAPMRMAKIIRNHRSGTHCPGVELALAMYSKSVAYGRDSEF